MSEIVFHDANASVRTLISRYLKRYGFDIVEISDLSKCEEALKSCKDPQALIVDMSRQPEMLPILQNFVPKYISVSDRCILTSVQPTRLAPYLPENINESFFNHVIERPFKKNDFLKFFEDIIAPVNMMKPREAGKSAVNSSISQITGQFSASDIDDKLRLQVDNIVKTNSCSVSLQKIRRESESGHESEGTSEVRRINRMSRIGRSHALHDIRQPSPEPHDSRNPRESSAPKLGKGRKIPPALSTSKLSASIKLKSLSDPPSIGPVDAEITVPPTQHRPLVELPASPSASPHAHSKPPRAQTPGLLPVHSSPTSMQNDLAALRQSAEVPSQPESTPVHTDPVSAPSIVIPAARELHSLPSLPSVHSKDIGQAHKNSPLLPSIPGTKLPALHSEAQSLTETTNPNTALLHQPGTLLPTSRDEAVLDAFTETDKKIEAPKLPKPASKIHKIAHRNKISETKSEKINTREPLISPEEDRDESTVIVSSSGIDSAVSPVIPVRDSQSSSVLTAFVAPVIDNRNLQLPWLIRLLESSSVYQSKFTLVIRCGSLVHVFFIEAARAFWFESFANDHIPETHEYLQSVPDAPDVDKPRLLELVDQNMPLSQAFKKLDAADAASRLCTECVSSGLDLLFSKLLGSPCSIYDGIPDCWLPIVRMRPCKFIHIAPILFDMMRRTEDMVIPPAIFSSAKFVTRTYRTPFNKRIKLNSAELSLLSAVKMPLSIAELRQLGKKHTGDAFYRLYFFGFADITD